MSLLNCNSLCTWLSSDFAYAYPTRHVSRGRLDCPFPSRFCVVLLAYGLLLVLASSNVRRVKDLQVSFGNAVSEDTSRDCNRRRDTRPKTLSPPSLDDQPRIWACCVHPTRCPFSLMDGIVPNDHVQLDFVHKSLRLDRGGSCQPSAGWCRTPMLGARPLS